ncbi:hypothetical protein [Haliscomenobacter hydrossis]|uniref:Uncharacterized protein n=1 Tax=Haliscomenobacter hydrossis (strain ATCC 27775 / DSM 1100 / LMG 10767 / O) TaxID=760192 RepID=F4KXP2_HALH1|nr:hypothetical protein [Haliscomenobacter hydrossis]AEE51403.1 hypothetical protein Halhy_3548 [Haliscomenobacter hydrossis DSM 1100]
MMRYLTLLHAAMLIGYLTCPELEAQNKPVDFLPEGSYKVMGFNTTPLLVQLIPFNRSDPRVVGPYYVNWRSYMQNARGLKGFKISLGIDLSDANGEAVQAFLNFRLGFEGYRKISPRWGYTRGFSVMFSAGDFNTPGTKQDDNVFFGFGPHWGVDFFVSPKVSLSVETALVFGTASPQDFGVGGGPRFEFIPPVALNLNFWAPKRERRIIK